MEDEFLNGSCVLRNDSVHGRNMDDCTSQDGWLHAYQTLILTVRTPREGEKKKRRKIRERRERYVESSPLCLVVGIG